MLSQSASPTRNQTKLQQDRQRLKEFYSNKEKATTNLRANEEIESVKVLIKEKIDEVKKNNDKMDVFQEQINSLVQTFDHIDHQLETLDFKEKVESLLKDLDN